MHHHHHRHIPHQLMEWIGERLGLAIIHVTMKPALIILVLVEALSKICNILTWNMDIKSEKKD